MVPASSNIRYFLTRMFTDTRTPRPFDSVVAQKPFIMQNSLLIRRLRLSSKTTSTDNPTPPLITLHSSSDPHLAQSSQLRSRETRLPFSLWLDTVLERRNQLHQGSLSFDPPTPSAKIHPEVPDHCPQMAPDYSLTYVPHSGPPRLLHRAKAVSTPAL